MDDLSDDDRRSNLCADLVSLKRLEPALLDLFGRQAGTWVTVRQLYRRCGLVGEDIEPGLMATWLAPPPDTEPGYALVLFFEVETVWSLTAYYNLGWLMEQRSDSSGAD